ncbi:hypothetical protein BDR22DRAFT_36882 [Usnea florida]
MGKNEQAAKRKVKRLQEVIESSSLDLAQAQAHLNRARLTKKAREKRKKTEKVEAELVEAKEQARQALVATKEANGASKDAKKAAEAARHDLRSLRDKHASNETLSIAESREQELRFAFYTADHADVVAEKQLYQADNRVWALQRRLTQLTGGSASNGPTNIADKQAVNGSEQSRVSPLHTKSPTPPNGPTNIADKQASVNGSEKSRVSPLHTKSQSPPPVVSRVAAEDGIGCDASKANSNQDNDDHSFEDYGLNWDDDADDLTPLKDIEIPHNAISTVSPSPVKSSSPTKSGKLSTPATTPSKESTPAAPVAKSPAAQDEKDGTASNPVDLDAMGEQPKSSWGEADNESCKRQEAEKEAQFQKLLAISDPLATLVKEFSDTLKENPEARIGSTMSTITASQFKTLLPDVWFGDEILTSYLALLVEYHEYCQALLSTAFVFAEQALANYSHAKSSGATVDKGSPCIPIDDHATTFLIPINVSRNHWILCVARRDEANQFSGYIEWYNSMSSYDAAALDAVKSVKMVLEWIGEDPSNPIANVSWTIRQCKSGIQNDGSSCGPFVAANATAVAHGIPVPRHVNGVRQEMASVMLASAQNLPIDWTSFKDMLVTIGPATDEPTEKSVADLTGGEDVDDGETDVDEEVGNAFPETEWQCDICYYYYASSDADLVVHKLEKHDTEQFLCRWPGCQIACDDANSLAEHVRLIHEMEMWFCEGKDCYQRFATELEINDHMDAVHPEENLANPRLIDPRFRTFKATDLAAERDHCLERFRARYPTVEARQEQRAYLYASYYSITLRDYFAQRGLNDQQSSGGPDVCRTVKAIYTKRPIDQNRPKTLYTLKIDSKYYTRSWATWIVLLHQEEGSRLDKFIDDMLLGWCEVSHKCHRPWCFVNKHLEYVRTANNFDRSICMHGTRRDVGDCQAENSLHSHDVCHLDTPLGDPFDKDLPPPIKRIARRKPHNPKGSFKCSRCNYVARTSMALSFHLRFHRQTPHLSRVDPGTSGIFFQCWVKSCGQLFWLAKERDLHHDTHRDDSDGIKCLVEKCLLTFRTPSDRKEHEKRGHRDQYEARATPRISPATRSNTRKRKASADDQSQLETAKYTRYSPEVTYETDLENRQYPCRRRCGAILTNADMRLDHEGRCKYQSDGEAEFPCPKGCGLTFGSAKKLSSHVGQCKIWECRKGCGEQCFSARSREHHEEQCGDPSREKSVRYLCPQGCGAELGSRAAQMHHLERCQIKECRKGCGQKCNTAHSLMHHELLCRYPNPPKFPCLLGCGAALGSKSAQKRHSNHCNRTGHVKPRRR